MITCPHCHGECWKTSAGPCCAYQHGNKPCPLDPRKPQPVRPMLTPECRELPSDRRMTKEQEVLRDLTEAYCSCFGGYDLTERCTRVFRTGAGDYDCEGCKWCHLQATLAEAEKLWNA